MIKKIISTTSFSEIEELRMKLEEALKAKRKSLGESEDAFFYYTYIEGKPRILCMVRYCQDTRMLCDISKENGIINITGRLKEHPNKKEILKIANRYLNDWRDQDN